MTAKELSKKFTRKDIEQTLWVRTTDGEILRLTSVGRKYINLMYGNGEKKQVESVIDVQRFASDLKQV